MLPKTNTNSTLEYTFEPVHLDDSSLQNHRPVACDISISGKFYCAAWPNGLIRIWCIKTGILLKELDSGQELQGLAIVEHRDLLLIQPSGDLRRIKAEHYLPYLCMKSLLDNSLEKDDWIEDALPQLQIKAGDVQALTKICKDDFEARRDRFKQLAANRVANLLSWVNSDKDNSKRRYLTLLEKLKERKERIMKMRRQIADKALRVATLKSGKTYFGSYLSDDQKEEMQ